jgi:hypothetical protein
MTEEEARIWRNEELKVTDSIIQTEDHPQRSLHYKYRAALRDWPSTSDFPDTKPTL